MQAYSPKKRRKKAHSRRLRAIKTIFPFGVNPSGKRRSRHGAKRHPFSGVARVATGIIVHVFHLLRYAIIG